MKWNKMYMCVCDTHSLTHKIQQCYNFPFMDIMISSWGACCPWIQEFNSIGSRSNSHIVAHWKYTVTTGQRMPNGECLNMVLFQLLRAYFGRKLEQIVGWMILAASRCVCVCVCDRISLWNRQWWSAAFVPSAFRHCSRLTRFIHSEWCLFVWNALTMARSRAHIWIFVNVSMPKCTRIEFTNTNESTFCIGSLMLVCRSRENQSCARIQTYP